VERHPRAACNRVPFRPESAGRDPREAAFHCLRSRQVFRWSPAVRTRCVSVVPAGLRRPNRCPYQCRRPSVSSPAVPVTKTCNKSGRLAHRAECSAINAGIRFHGAHRSVSQMTGRIFQLRKLANDRARERDRKRQRAQSLRCSSAFEKAEGRTMAKVTIFLICQFPVSCSMPDATIRRDEHSDTLSPGCVRLLATPVCVPRR